MASKKTIRERLNGAKLIGFEIPVSRAPQAMVGATPTVKGSTAKVGETATIRAPRAMVGNTPSVKLKL